jgi:AP endonuclease-1
VEKKVKKHRKRKTKEQKATEAIKLGSDGEVVEKKVKKKRKRKTKEEKAAEAMPIATRTTGHKLLIGAHVSAAGGKYLLY